MGRFIVRRLGFLVLMVLLSSMIIFVATEVLPGDVATMMLGRFATPQAKDSLRQELGLDEPLVRPVRQPGSRDFVQRRLGHLGQHAARDRPLVLERLRNSPCWPRWPSRSSCRWASCWALLAACGRNSGSTRRISVGSLAFIGLPSSSAPSS